jgi:hypothetical protein
MQFCARYVAMQSRGVSVTIRNSFYFVAIMLVLSACGGGNSGSLFGKKNPDGLASHVIKLDGREASIGGPTALGTRYAISDVEVTVPASLIVSEANLFYPSADIVWRGEPQGDRYAQVAAIMQDGLEAGVVSMKTGPHAVLSVQLERFHALTEKARFSVGGVHDIIFVMTVREAGTDRVLEGPQRVEVPIRASGRDAAIAEDAAGRTQRVVIVEGLAEAIRRELSVMPIVETKRKGLFAGLSQKG